MNLTNAIFKGGHQIKLSRDLQVKYSYNLWHDAAFIGIDLQTDRAVRSVWKTHSVHVYFWSISLVWPAFDRTACSRCPWWLLELSQHLSSWKFCQRYQLNLNPYCAFSAFQESLICSSNFRLLSFTVAKTNSLSLSLFSPDYFKTC